MLFLCLNPVSGSCLTTAVLIKREFRRIHPTENIHSGEQHTVFNSKSAITPSVTSGTCSHQHLLAVLNIRRDDITGMNLCPHDRECLWCPILQSTATNLDYFTEETNSHCVLGIVTEDCDRILAVIVYWTKEIVQSLQMIRFSEKSTGQDFTVDKKLLIMRIYIRQKLQRPCVLSRGLVSDSHCSLTVTTLASTLTDTDAF
ncbi:hypothetical protein RRG08_001302 [Elysia crispata]|uniref:Uncharacterized protein n=1 Tax=Elysia crispata TaxID=231223 RepID=A0AAE0Y676_9GAST|nr:hypothetical protein RRG08_001302 [Elysia crispata]